MDGITDNFNLLALHQMCIVYLHVHRIFVVALDLCVTGEVLVLPIRWQSTARTWLWGS